jgi:polyphosphate kinase 2 (PPK2 family)
MSHGCGTIFLHLDQAWHFGDFIEKFGVIAKGEATASSLHRRIHGELVDSFDEELEMEIDDDRLAKLPADIADHPDQKTIDRRFYFQELLRLQCELVELQDWVVHQKLKVVVIFEGRDAAGKGGVIKRITQRMDRSVCRVVSCSTGPERSRTHPMVFSTLCLTPPSRRRNRALRPQLV